MIIYILTTQGKMLEYVGTLLRKAGHITAVFTERDRFFSTVEQEGPLRVDMLVCDFLSMGIMQPNPYAAMIERNRIIPFLFYNDPFPLAEDRAIYWYSRLRQVCSDTMREESLIKLMPTFLELQNILKRADVFPFINLISQAKNFVDEIELDGFDCEAFKLKHHIQDSKYALFKYLYKNRGELLSAEYICKDLWNDVSQNKTNMLYSYISSLREIFKCEKDYKMQILRECKGKYRFIIESCNSY